MLLSAKQIYWTDLDKETLQVVVFYFYFLEFMIKLIWMYTNS